MTVGGNLILYPSECGTPTVDLLTVKLLLNSIISSPGEKFLTIDINNFYLNTPMESFEYTHLFSTAHLLEPKNKDNVDPILDPPLWH